jgi:hypothetical protein
MFTGSPAAGVPMGNVTNEIEKRLRLFLFLPDIQLNGVVMLR